MWPWADMLHVEPAAPKRTPASEPIADFQSATPANFGPATPWRWPAGWKPQCVAADVSRRIHASCLAGPPPYGGGYGNSLAWPAGWKCQCVAADVTPRIHPSGLPGPPPYGGGYGNGPVGLALAALEQSLTPLPKRRKSAGWKPALPKAAILALGVRPSAYARRPRRQMLHGASRSGNLRYASNTNLQ